MDREVSRLSLLRDHLSHTSDSNMAPPAIPVKMNENGIPAFDDLPLREGDPFHSAWGLYGGKDELGTLNRLTDERVATAAKTELKTGVRCVLNSQPTLA